MSKIVYRSKVVKKVKVSKKIKREGAKILDGMRLLSVEVSKLSLSNLKNSSIYELDDIELFSLHAGVHQLYESIAGELIGVVVKGFVATGIFDDDINSLILTSRIDTEMPVFIINNSSAYGLVDLKEPIKIEKEKIKNLNELLYYSDNSNFFKYKITHKNKFIKRLVVDNQTNEQVIDGVELSVIGNKFSRSEIVTVHNKVVEEIHRREFNHQLMTDLDRRTMLLMRVGKNASTLFSLTDKELKSAHNKVHNLYVEKNSSKSDLLEMQAIHASIIDIFAEKRIPHEQHSGDDLDSINSGFRAGLGGLIERKVNKGVEEDRGVSLQEVLASMNEIKFSNNLISLVGDIVLNGETDGDIDLLLDSELIPERLRSILEYVILSKVPVNTQDKVNFYYDTYPGSTIPNIPLFNMEISRINKKNIVIDDGGGEIIDHEKPIRATLVEDSIEDAFYEERIEGENVDFTIQSKVKDNSKTHILNISIGGNKAYVWQIGGKQDVYEQSGSDIDGNNNHVTGLFIERKLSASILMDQLIRSYPVGMQNVDWMNTEGIIEGVKAGDSNEVIKVIDTGTCEFGIQLPWIKEYFLSIPECKYGKLIIRKLRVSRIHFDQIMKNEQLYKVLFDNILKENVLRMVENKMVEMYSTTIYDDNMFYENIENIWVAYFSNEIPFILSINTKIGYDQKIQIKEGVSLLPAKIKSQIPEKYQYWETTGSGVRKTINSLIEQIHSGNIKLSNVNTKSVSTANAIFSLQHILAYGKIINNEVIDRKENTKRWMLYICTGEEEILSIELQDNPLDHISIKCEIGREYDNNLMLSEDEIVGGHCSILDGSTGLALIEFHSERLTGKWLLKKEQEHWVFLKIKDNIKKKEEYSVEIAKSYSDELRLVTGIVLIPDKRDVQKDKYNAKVIREAAHNYLSEINILTGTGFMHSLFEDGKMEVVESWLAPCDLTIGAKKITKGTWVMTMRILDDIIWRMIKDKKIKGFSIGGIALVSMKNN